MKLNINIRDILLGICIIAVAVMGYLLYGVNKSTTTNIDFLASAIYSTSTSTPGIIPFLDNFGATDQNMDIGTFDVAVYHSINRINASLSAQQSGQSTTTKK